MIDIWEWIEGQIEEGQQLERIIADASARIDHLQASDAEEHTVNIEDLRSTIQLLQNPLHPPGVSPVPGDDLSLEVGSFAYTPVNDRGIGKVRTLDTAKVEIEYFLSLTERDVVSLPFEQVQRVRVSPQTRCYRYDDELERWRIGRTGNHLEDSIEVHFPGMDSAYLPEAEVFVRCADSEPNPFEKLVHKGHETAFFHKHRAPFVEALHEQRRWSLGMDAVLSASIHLYPHQLDIARRVLADPVQRYLLADEVGLGKTIEAGLVIRQHLLDHPRGDVLVLVPPPLVDQWRDELDKKFFAFRSPVRVRVVSFEEVLEERGPVSMLVVDEAHHASSWAYEEGATSQDKFDRVRELAHGAEKLVLCSATPALNNEREFLAMLHLLDPVRYDLGDLDAFRDRVQKRKEIGDILLSVTESASDFILKLNVPKLRDAFPRDKRLMVLADQLETAIEGDGVDARSRNDLVRAIRLHVSETYRLHRRMLRTRRQQTENSVLFGRDGADLGRHALRAEQGMDLREEIVHDLLEEWRREAVLHLGSLPEDRKRSLSETRTRLFTLLLELAGSDLGLLAEAIRVRLKERGPGTRLSRDLSSHEIDLLTTPSFDGETELLSQMNDAAVADVEEGDLDRGGFLEMLLEASRSQLQNAVVFTQYPSVAERIFDHLQAVFGIEAVAGHFEDSEGAIEDEVRRFRETEGCFILVCDPSAEEGRNLQFADFLVHYDLPFAPNRLEQRTGRLDRIGRTTPMRTRVILGPALDHASAYDAWFKLLDEGLDLFSKSIAAFQFYIEKKRPELLQLLFLKGPDGLVDEVPRIHTELQEEIKAVNRQDAIDAIRPEDTGVANYVEQLRSYDEDSASIRRKMEPWVTHALNFQRRIDQGITYAPRRNTLVPSDMVLSRFLRHVQHHGVYDREHSTREGLGLYRLGNGFIDNIAEYIRWDDRGTAFAIWRQHDGWPPEYGREWVGFRFDVIVEADIAEALRTVEERGEDVHALRRRADALFPPLYKTLFVGTDGVVETREPVLKVLDQPFKRLSKGGGDTNLHKERVVLIDEFVEPRRWESVCRKAHEVATETLLTSSAMEAHIHEATGAARRDLERRMDRLAMRADDVDGTAEAKDEEEHQYEEAIGNHLMEGTEAPLVTVDAVGFMVVTGREPELSGLG